MTKKLQIWESRCTLYTLTTGSFCTVQLCLLFIDGATGCFYLPSTLVRRMLDVREALVEWGGWADGRVFILFSGTGSGFCSRLHWSGTEPVRIFPPFVMTSYYKWWEKFPQTQICSSGSGTNPDPVPEKSINRLPTAPLLSCSLSVKEERSEVEGR